VVQARCTVDPPAMRVARHCSPASTHQPSDIDCIRARKGHLPGGAVSVVCRRFALSLTTFFMQVITC
jgi:hypothetical protein